MILTSTHMIPVSGVLNLNMAYVAQLAGISSAGSNCTAAPYSRHRCIPSSLLSMFIMVTIIVVLVIVVVVKNHDCYCCRHCYCYYCHYYYKHNSSNHNYYDYSSPGRPGRVLTAPCFEAPGRDWAWLRWVQESRNPGS